MKTSNYMTRALQAKDPRFANILGRLGYERTDITSTAAQPDPLDHDGDGRKGGSKPAERNDEIEALRSRYFEKFGKRAFHGWDAETIAAKIAETED